MQIAGEELIALTKSSVENEREYYSTHCYICSSESIDAASLDNGGLRTFCNDCQETVEYTSAMRVVGTV
jgi:hypothetical protein